MTKSSDGHEKMIPVMTNLSFFMTMLSLAIILSFVIGLGSASSCGYESCNPSHPEKLNVHLIPHSHDDVGWLKTVDQYFYGSKRGGWGDWEVQRAGVQYTLDTIVTELAFDTTKRFIQVETAFFWRWWEQQEEDTQDLVRVLVEAGQLEFVGGGWCMNDEGAAHYVGIIDQMSLGLRLLNETFGGCGVPRVAWQIDPFGHSKEQASLFADMSLDGLFIGRLDYRDKIKRKETLGMEMVWESSQDVGDSLDLFTGVLYGDIAEYGPPPGFCWDLPCNDDPIMDDTKLHDNNVNSVVQNFVEYVKKQATIYRTNNVIVPMGEDFQYQAAHSWFINLDKLIKHTNSMDDDVNVFYSTPSCYLKALHEADISWPTKSDDFLPYASAPHAYWSGYFTSRPSSKYMIRQAERYSKIATQREALENYPDEQRRNIEKLEMAIAVAQHHDAITGTEKQHVTNDYHQRLHEGLEMILDSENIHPQYDMNIGSIGTFCPLLNISQCPITEEITDQVTIEVYNPLSRIVDHFIRVPVVDGQFTVHMENSSLVKHQLVPISPEVKALPGRSSKATHELITKVESVPALGSKFVTIFKNNITTNTFQKSKNNPKALKHEKILGKGNMRLVLNMKTNTITHIVDNKRNIREQFTQDFFFYKSHEQENVAKKKKDTKASGAYVPKAGTGASGAYIFRPASNEAFPIGKPTQVSLHLGELVDEIHQTYKDGWISQVTRIYHSKDYIEQEWMVGPMPISIDGQQVGIEVISRYYTGIENNGVFYTDSNGRQMIERIRDQRPTYEINMTEPVAMNYYPVNSKIMIKDDRNHLTVLTDRSQGGASLEDGAVELMLHRRMLFDDGFGVGEALNEKAFGTGLVARGKHFILFNNDPEEANKNHRIVAMDVFYKPLDIIYRNNPMKESHQGLTNPLSDNVHLLTIQKLKSDSSGMEFLLRLEHIFQQDEHQVLSLPASVDLENIFQNFKVVKSRETNLAANMWKDEVSRLEFKKINTTNNLHGKKMDNQVALDSMVVELNPMEIRTFKIQLQKKQ